MNKNRGIWFVIGGILILGLLVTFAISHFIKDKAYISEPQKSALSSGAEFSESAGDAGPAPRMFSADSAQNRTAGNSPAGPEIKNRKMAVPDTSDEADVPSQSVPETDTAAYGALSETGADSTEEEESRVPEAEPKALLKSAEEPALQETVLSPIAPDKKAVLRQEETGAEGADSYRERLDALDEQIEKMWKESGDSNTYSMKAMADKELKLWARSLAEIYEAVCDGLDEEAKAELEESQKNWMKDRDAKADEDAKKYSGGTLEELEYTMSQAASTKSRAYELIEKYME